MRKRKLKNILWASGILLLVAILIIVPFLMEARAGEAAEEVSILSANAERTTIATTLSGTGVLSEENVISVGVPDGVKLKEYLVEDGQQVEAGDALATVDTLSVMTSISEVQETLDYLKEQMEEAADNEAEASVTAQAGGRVMELYCAEGDDVRSVMLEHGALAVLSLDGLMAVDFETEADVTTGDEVYVNLADGTQVEGYVESALFGQVTVCLSDDGPSAGEEVTITTLENSGLGSGELYIHSEWRASAYTGTVESVKVSVGDEVSGGGTLFTLSDTEDTSEYELLTAKHRVYEEILTELFVLYQEKTIYAAESGVVTLPEDTSMVLLSAGEGGYVLQLLANAPTGDDTLQYINYVGHVTQCSYGALTLNMQTAPIEVTDYLALASQSLSTDTMTEPTTYAPAANTPVFSLAEGAWRQGTLNEIVAGDILLFAYTPESQEPVWIVRLSKAAEPDQPDDPDQPGEQPEDPGIQPEDPNAQPENGGQNQGGEQVPSGSGGQMPSFSGGQQSGMSSGGSFFQQSGLYSQYQGTAIEEEVMELYNEAKTEVLTLTPQSEVNLTITVDELDILQAQLGQEAAVTLDALPGRSFVATVTEINTTGSNSGGNSKYSVTLTMPREEDMIAGMNASAVITLEEHTNVLSVPVAALVDEGSKTYVYCSSSEEEGLGDKTEVTTGISDGENVEILSGLEDNDEIWYEYYEQVPFADMMPGGRGPGGFGGFGGFGGGFSPR